MFQSILIISTTPERRMAEAMKLLDQESVDKFDRTIIDREEVASKTGTPKQKLSLGIEDIKIMQKTLSLKPFRSQSKAIIIKDAHLLTIEAQNALLKVLEEPPVNTILILLAEKPEALLPTVLSRCQILQLQEDVVTLSAKDQLELDKLLDALPTWGVGKSLAQAEHLAKNKDAAIIWIEKIILTAREKMLENMSLEKPNLMKQKNYLEIITSFEKTRSQIKNTNVNLRLALEVLLLR